MKLPVVDLKKEEFVEYEWGWRLASAVAVVSALFSFAVCVLLIANYYQVRTINPLENPQLLQLRAQLAAAPKADETLVQQVRALDLFARKAFFTSQAHLRIGGHLLLGGVIVFLVSFKLTSSWRPRLPELGEEQGATQQWYLRARSRRLLTGAGIGLVCFAVFAALFGDSGIPSPESLLTAESQANLPEDEQGLEAEAFPTWEAVQLQWPSFRGPGGYGVAHFSSAPIDWDGESGRGIRWKVKVPRSGANSPVVWDNRVFISGADEEVREVYCYDADTGRLLWQSPLPKFPGSPERPPRVTRDTGYAAPTLAVHGSRVFAIFGTGDLACFDFEGNLQWGFNLGVPDNHYGHSSSLIAYDNKLFVQYDQRSNARLLALHAATGNQLWEVKRESVCWASPVCLPTPLGVQLVLNSEKTVDAYDPETGKLIWSQECLRGEVGPSPAYGDGVVFVANESAVASAIRLPEGAGSTQTEILWQWDETLPDVSSPVGTGEHFFLTTSFGEIVCLDARTGEEMWMEEVDEGFYSSPVLVGDRIYALNRDGIMYICKAGPKFELLGSPKLGEPALTTPAYLDGRIYIRTSEHLYCIEGQDA